MAPTGAGGGLPPPPPAGPVTPSPASQPTRSTADVLDIQDYLDATSDAAKRTRTISYAIVLTSIIAFAGLLNSLQSHWMRDRLSLSRNSSYVSSFIGPPTTDDDPERNRRYDHYFSTLLRTYAENVLVVRVPFFGITLDINDVAPLGGLAFLVLLVMMRFCLSREADNLRLAFFEATSMKQGREFYRLLAMQQVLTVPPGTTIERTRLLVWTPKVFVALPVLVHSLVAIHELDTMWVVLPFAPLRAWAHVTITTLLLVPIALLTWNIIGRLRSIDAFWKRMYRQVVSARTDTSLISSCHHRFETVVFDERPLVEAGHKDPLEWHERFWNLQFDQYQYWNQGAIDDDTYAHWMYQRHVEWLENKKTGGLSYRKGWEHAVQKFGWKGKEFEQFMKDAFSGKNKLLLTYRFS
jgi:hypothetical protein